jgi:hypothetical protein
MSKIKEIIEMFEPLDIQDKDREDVPEHRPEDMAYIDFISQIQVLCNSKNFPKNPNKQ